MTLFDATISEPIDGVVRVAGKPLIDTETDEIGPETRYEVHESLVVKELGPVE